MKKRWLDYILCFSTLTKQLLYFYRHFLSSISNLNCRLNLHRDAWWISTYLFRPSLLVINPNHLLLPKAEQNNMKFYLRLKSILRRFLPGKWVPLGQTVQGCSKHAELFARFRWPLICVIIIKSSSKTVLFLVLVIIITPPSFPYFSCHPSSSLRRQRSRRVEWLSSLALILFHPSPGPSPGPSPDPSPYPSPPPPPPASLIISNA